MLQHQLHITGQLGACRRPASRVPSVVIRAAATTDKAQPDWTGGNVTSRVVNWMINTKPIFEVMQLGAKTTMKSALRRAGIDWDGHVRNMQQQQTELQSLCDEFSRQPDPQLQYPSYYTVPFHSYEQGNLSWQAAYEVEPASYAIALRTFKNEQLSGEQALRKLRTGINEQIQEYYRAHGLPPPFTLLDVGCSTGISSTWYQQLWPQADVTGLDLSPYFLAVAELQQRQQATSDSGDHDKKHRHQKRIRYMRGLAESTGFPAASWECVMFSFIAHECPQQTLRDFMTEAKRILKPGGVICFVDTNPKSKVIQNLPPFLFSLMKSTEPWSDEYYSFDMEAALAEAGFRNITTTEASPRHRTIFGIAS